MTPETKDVSDLKVSDLIAWPVWEFAMDLEAMGLPETIVRPVQRLPVDSLASRPVGTEVRLKNGELRWAILGNLSLRNPRRTQQFLTLSVEKDGKWFHLLRYFEIGRERMGPDQLASFLGLPTDEVFSVRYDISGVAIGHPSVVRGTIPREPEERLSRDELGALVRETIREDLSGGRQAPTQAP